MEKYDLIIVGAGPAGLTAAVYAARYKLKTVVIGRLLGGLASEAHEVCNFPGFGRINGIELIKKFVQQVHDLKVEIKAEEVLDVQKKGKEFLLTTNKEKYSCKKIILATGNRRRKLELEKEEEFTGKGISYCATCDAPFYKEKVIAVIGGSNAALTSALLLSKFAKKVYIIYRGEKFERAEPIRREEVKENKKIEVLFNTTITDLSGKDHLEGIIISQKGKESVLKLDGIFIEIGSDPNTFLAERLKLKMEGKNISVDKKQKTSVKGVFAAGDVTDNPLKQIVTACGEGAIAADSAYRELI